MWITASSYSIRCHRAVTDRWLRCERVTWASSRVLALQNFQCSQDVGQDFVLCQKLCNTIPSHTMRCYQGPSLRTKRLSLQVTQHTIRYLGTVPDCSSVQSGSSYPIQLDVKRGHRQEKHEEISMSLPSEHIQSAASCCYICENLSLYVYL